MKAEEVLFFFQAEDGIRDIGVTGVQTCALPIWVAQPGAGELDGGGQGLDRAVLAEHHRLQVALEILQRLPVVRARSEERRVGKECRSRRSLYHYKKM